MLENGLSLNRMIREKLKETHQAGLIRDPEFHHASLFVSRVLMERGVVSPWNQEDQAKTLELLNLAAEALQDKASLSVMQAHPLSDREHLEVWAGWIRAALVDSQVAYALDKGHTALQEIGTDDASCEGGSNNRIIASLHLIHPDVTLREGRGAERNKEQWKALRDQQLLNELCQNVPDLLRTQGHDLSVKEARNFIWDRAFEILQRPLPNSAAELERQRAHLSAADLGLAETLIATLELIDEDLLSQP